MNKTSANGDVTGCSGCIAELILLPVKLACSFLGPFLFLIIVFGTMAICGGIFGAFGGVG